MPGRKYQASATSNYRYSINGQEKSDELNENLTTALYWEYDSRIGRRWNVDPKGHTWESPYLCFGGSPIWFSDVNGDVFMPKNGGGDPDPPIVSSAPVKYRVNESNGKTLHGYFNKGYNLNIYGNSSVAGFRANSDGDNDWSGAKAGGTTQSSNSFETKYGVSFNPNILYGTQLVGNGVGQNHFDGLNGIGAGTGDLTITFKIDNQGKVINNIYGVVFDRGPNTQAGESSIAANQQLKVRNDDNMFVFMVFPGSRKYLEQQVGLDGKGKMLRSPTNADIATAYNTMTSTDFANSKGQGTQLQIQNTNMFWSVFHKLTSEAMISNFDKPTKQEKEYGKIQPANNYRNANK